MINIHESISSYSSEVSGSGAQLVAISKTKPDEDLIAAYDAGQRHFGENKVQELCGKYERLPKDIQWHMVGHLQRNKVKFIAPFVHLIHSVDSVRLLTAIDKEGKKFGRVINVLLQVHIAKEETKFGFSETEIKAFLTSEDFKSLTHVRIAGLMGMATNTKDAEVVTHEFKQLKSFFDELKAANSPLHTMDTLSMGMSGDYKIALKEGSTMVRIGSSIFGARNYVK